MPDTCTPRGHSASGALVYSLRENGPGLRLSTNFVLVEFASRDGADEVKVHPALVALLEDLRERVGKPVHINSGYRSPAHNRRIGGASRSRHVMGLAADVTVRGMTPSQVWKVLAAMNPGGLGRYRSFTHVDVEGTNRRWDNR